MVMVGALNVLDLIVPCATIDELHLLFLQTCLKRSLREMQTHILNSNDLETRSEYGNLIQATCWIDS